MPSMIKLLAGQQPPFSRRRRRSPRKNAGDNIAVDALPFSPRDVAVFDTPWALAFLDANEMLVTEKGGRIWLVSAEGGQATGGGVPDVVFDGQLGLLDIAPAPDFKTSGLVYFTYVEPDSAAERSLWRAPSSRATMARPRWKLEGGLARRGNGWRRAAWRRHRLRAGWPAHFPDGRRSHAFRSGRRTCPRRKAASSDWTLDGAPAPGNPFEARKTARPGIWSYGHRNPYGLAFAPDGKLWAHEMGPRGGDELNRIEAGSNYGWPLVSNGDQYSGAAIPRIRHGPI